MLLSAIHPKFQLLSCTIRSIKDTFRDILYEQDSCPRASIWNHRKWSRSSKRYLHPRVHSSIIYNSQDMETTWAFVNRRMGTEDREMLQGTLLSHEKGGNPAICDITEQPWGHYAKSSGIRGKTNTALGHLYVESKKAQIIKTESKKCWFLGAGWWWNRRDV